MSDSASVKTAAHSVKGLTLDTWFETWFEKYKVPVLKINSANARRNKYRNSFGKRIGDMRLTDILNINIQNAVNEMVASGMGTSSLRDSIGLLRECLENAKNNQLIAINPCFEIIAPHHVTKRLARFLTASEQDKFLQTVKGDWYEEMFYLMFYSGLRIGEVGALQWEDIDFKNKCLHIKHSLSCQYLDGKKMMMIVSPKTQNSYRTIPFLGNVEEMLRSQKKKQDRLKKELGDRWRAEDCFGNLVFSTTLGSPVARHIAERTINNIVKAINEEEAVLSVKEQREPVVFERMYPHCIRHTFCSRCFEAGINPKVIQQIMGHVDYSTTLNVYTHITEATMKKEVERYNSALSAKSNVFEDAGLDVHNSHRPYYMQVSEMFK